MRKVMVVPYTDEWRTLFLREAADISDFLKIDVKQVHHIGSTAINTIKAKPIIDILVEVSEIDYIDSVDFSELGYRALGENGIKERRFFIKGGNIRTHHLHIFEIGNDEVSRHLQFRDYLINHPSKALEYSYLKEKLAEKFPNDIESYIKGKDAFIKSIDEEARKWKKESC